MKEKVEAKLEEYKKTLVQLNDQAKALNVAVKVCEQLLEEKPEEKENKEG